MEPRPDLSKLRIDRERRKTGGAGWVVAFLVVLAGGAWFAWDRYLNPKTAVPEVEVGRVQRVGGAQAQSGVSANGYVVARKQAALSTDIQGRLVELPVEEGMRVRAGDLIARLDTTQLEAALARARYEVARAEGELARSSAVQHWSVQERQRVEPLVQNGDLAPAELDRALAEEKQAAAAVQSWRAAIDAARAQASEIEVMIAKSSVLAPFGGVITRKNAEVGEVVSAIGATGPNARGAVATLVDFDTLEVQVELAQTSLKAARPGAPVLIYLDAFPEDAYRGRLRQVWPTADRQKATVELRVEFLERDDRILPEMGVRVVFVPEEATAVRPTEILVPETALVQGPEPAVFLFNGGQARRRAVTLSASGGGGGQLNVASGLEGNELVILNPPAGLKDGDGVRRKQEDS